MPTFTKRIRFLDLTGARSVELDALVDTGATFSQVPAEAAQQLGLVNVGSRRLRLADGRIVEHAIANALVQAPERGEPVATTVIIGEPGSTVLLGAHALDALGLGIDTEGQRLIEKIGYLLLETSWSTF